MPIISFNAFSFLQKKLRAQNRPFSHNSLEIPEGTTVTALLKQVGLIPEDVEAVFLNGRVTSWETILEDGDRVALVPPGTPGPYRVLLGIRKTD